MPAARSARSRGEPPSVREMNSTVMPRALCTNQYERSVAVAVCRYTPACFHDPASTRRRAHQTPTSSLPAGSVFRTCPGVMMGGVSRLRYFGIWKRSTLFPAQVNMLAPFASFMCHSNAHSLQPLCWGGGRREQRHLDTSESTIFRTGVHTDRSNSILLRGNIVNRTYGTHKNLYI